ncbi:hypothetical protein ASPCADRAFT_210892 [Aspergillus carbonarius ITEM 5010]|uniref:Uncharacterized protein n=1 Tax=Aspergillus carbonarius (strain ITEM 5010) TaxID=602072 RepID=A0A1R3RAL3_ASPC5|nr:hypothetical protein ASPCADRAFT_210892 [Aspergillus carbonarius ITEM 5010]
METQQPHLHAAFQVNEAFHYAPDPPRSTESVSPTQESYTIDHDQNIAKVHTLNTPHHGTFLRHPVYY